MNKRPTTIWPVIVLLWSVLVTLFTLSYIVTDAGHIMLSLGGDGGKNYYTYLYHILYEKGVGFNGMNYPYGEHTVYADAQPLISIPLSWLSGTCNITIENALAIMHLLMASGFCLAIIYTYKTLLHFKLKPLAALLFATLITLLSPQVLRISGHFALSYMSFVPMLFYFTLKYNVHQHIKYAIYLFLLTSVMSFLHPYYVAMSTVWICFYVFSYLVINKSAITSKIRHLLPLCIAVIASILLVKLFMGCTDPIKDRPIFPHGAVAYGTTGENIFTSAYSPIWQFLKDKQWVNEISEADEGFVYLGITVIGVCIFSLYNYFRLLIKKKKQQHATEEILFPKVWLLLAVCCLLLAMGVPFVWGMEWLLDYLSVFKQFRSLGRFSWLFYNIITVYGCVILYHHFIQQCNKGKIIRAYCLLIIPMLVWAFDASGYIGYLRNLSQAAHESYNKEKIKQSTEENWTQFLQKSNHSGQDFQALLLLPFVHIGSEKWSVRGVEIGIMSKGFNASMQLHLPIVDVMMSRSSWSQTAKQVRISAGPFADKPLLKIATKPFLVLKDDYDSISYDEQHLLKSATYLGYFAHCNVYVCYPEKVLRDDSIERAKVAVVADQMKHGDTVILNTPGNVFINHLDQCQQDKKFFGLAGMAPITSPDSLVATIDVQPTSDNQLYEISSWALVGDKDFRMPYFVMSLLDKDGKELLRKDALCRESVDNYGFWFRTALYFKMPVNCKTVNWRLYNNNKAIKALDEIILRPADATIISKSTDGHIMANNHIFK